MLAASRGDEKVEGHKAIKWVRGQQDLLSVAGLRACITSVSVCSSCLRDAKLLVGEGSQNVPPSRSATGDPPAGGC